MTEKTLVDEIIENARRDRRRLESVAEGLTNGFKQMGETDPGEEPLDPDVSAAFAEEIAKISDSLTKVNQQLVELVKIDAKKTLDASANQPAAKGGKVTKREAEEIFDELQGQNAADKELN